MKTDKKSKWLLIISFLFGLWQLNAQSFYNTFDRAQSIGEGVFEISGNLVHQSFIFESEAEPISYGFGLRGGVGLGDNFDIKASWTNLQFDEGERLGDDNINIFVFKPKYTFGGKNIALAVPIGVISSKAGGDKENEFYVSPEVMFNFPMSRFVEIGLNGRLVIPLEEENDEILAGLNVGLGISENLDQWAIRPEIGVLFDPGTDGEGFYLTPGIAFSYYIGGGY